MKGRSIHPVLSLVVLSLVTLALFAAPAAAQGDAAMGQTTFKKCQACHAVGEGARNRVGPVLNGVIGRIAGTAPDYKYSAAMQDAGAGGLVWTAETLKPYFAKPRDFIKGNKMAFAGITDQAEVDNLIAYLATFSPPPPSSPPAQ